MFELIITPTRVEGHEFLAGEVGKLVQTQSVGGVVPLVVGGDGFEVLLEDELSVHILGLADLDSELGLPLGVLVVGVCGLQEERKEGENEDNQK